MARSARPGFRPGRDSAKPVYKCIISRPNRMELLLFATGAMHVHRELGSSIHKMHGILAA
jgi:hypothetical protein